VVELERVCFGYGQEDLFRDTHLTLDPGNIYGLLGLNGAGKSTLLRLMTGLLFPGSGSLTALSYEPARREPGFLSKVFMLPEELNVPGVTDSEYISVRAPFYPGFDHDRMERFLGEFDIPRGRKLTELSHGQKKKFLLSFGLASNASLLMLDEPTNGLDIPSKGLFRRLVAEALSDEQIFVVSTHQVRDVESLIDFIVILHEGSVLFNHTVTQVTDNLRMSHSTSRPEEGQDALLFSEPTVGGFSTVWRDPNAGDRRLDLELLFKAVISSPDTYASLFETGK
jgi:ABC-2 type transport system ATP-binding protein